MAFAPDGRLFLTQQTGEIKVVKNGQMLPTNFATVDEDSFWERGLLGIALDPTFGQPGGDQYVYVLYTAITPAPHNRISRFVANGDIAGTEQVLVDFPNLGSSIGHMGGSINFGPDGKLYVAVGDYVTSANAQSLDTVAGKILRFNPDGSIPGDNPFFNQTSGVFQSIWALGLRNPFTTNWHLPSGRFFINDVGENSWEEVNLGAAGANYGWPATEGAFNPAQFPSYTNPLYTYGRTDGWAVIGGAIYDPVVNTFPAQYHGKYFFGDHVQGWIRYLDPVTKVVSNFASGGTGSRALPLRLTARSGITRAAPRPAGRESPSCIACNSPLRRCHPSRSSRRIKPSLWASPSRSTSARLAARRWRSNGSATT